MAHGYNPNRDKEGKFANGPVAAPSAAPVGVGGNAESSNLSAPDYEEMAARWYQFQGLTPPRKEWEGQEVLEGTTFLWGGESEYVECQVLVTVHPDPPNPRDSFTRSTIALASNEFGVGDTDHALNTDCSFGELVDQVNAQGGKGVHAVYVDDSSQGFAWEPVDADGDISSSREKKLVGVAFMSVEDQEAYRDAGAKVEVSEKNARACVAYELKGYDSYVRGDVLYAVAVTDGNNVETDEIDYHSGVEGAVELRDSIVDSLDNFSPFD